MRTMLLSAALGMMVPGLLPAAPRADRAARLPARIMVTLPAGAQLTIDGDATRSTGAVRRLVTAPIPQGKEFFYTFRVKWNRAGQMLTAKKKVPVRAGRETVVSFRFPRTRGENRGVGYASYRPGGQPPYGATQGQGDSRYSRPRTRIYRYRYTSPPRMRNTRTWTQDNDSVFD
jgi:uncharacterized protein (TIGR03000 family)